MNILVISKISNNEASGVANIIPEYIKYLSQKEKVVWYNLNPQYKVVEELKHLYHGYTGGRLNIKDKLLNKIDLVVFHGVCFKQYATLAKQAIAKKVPYIIIPHGSLTEYALRIKRFKKEIGLIVFMRQLVLNAAAIHYLSEGEKQKSTRLKPKVEIVIGNGMVQPKQSKQVFNNNKIQGIYIGRLMTHNKGLDLLIDACAKIKDEMFKNNMTIQLFGPEENGSRAQLKEMITSKQLEKVIILNEAVFGPEKAQKLLESDFFVLTSRSEGQPIAVLEAMGYGLPCLVTEGTNIAEEIVMYNAGWQAGNNCAQIVRALRQVIADQTKLQEKGAQAILLSKTYQWPQIIEKTIEEYRQFI